MKRMLPHANGTVSKKWKAFYLWLTVILLLVFPWLVLIFQHNWLKSPLEKELEDALETRRSLVASQHYEELASLLDQTSITIPAGEFIRGSNQYRTDEKPEQRVYLDAYQIDQYEITNTQYQRFLLATGETPPPYWDGEVFPEGQADYPVVGVTWEQANAYCQWAGKRLPTEAEWEKACRGTVGRIYPWGNQWHPSFANIHAAPNSDAPLISPAEGDRMWSESWVMVLETANNTGSPRLQPVGCYPDGSSPYGLQDMAGNASEWVLDWYTFTDYSTLPLKNPVNTGPEWNHALRGSAWYDPLGNGNWIQDQSRCSARNSSHKTFDARVGFRCAQSIGK